LVRPDTSQFEHDAVGQPDLHSHRCGVVVDNACRRCRHHRQRDERVGLARTDRTRFSTLLPNPATQLVGVDVELARQSRHGRSSGGAQRHQLRLRRLVEHLASVALVAHHEPSRQVFQLL
jgi:hypothetical protein